MAQPFMQGSMKKRTSVLVFLRGSAAPLVLYVENPIALYEELASVLKKPHAHVIIEKSLIGPIKKVCFNSDEMISIALQEEQYMQ